MRYLLQIYGNPKNWKHPAHEQIGETVSDDELANRRREFDAIFKEIEESGELVLAQALMNPKRAISIRAKNGAPSVTDGPFAETKEQLAGFFLLECESNERALEIALRFPDARFGALEIRQIDEGPGEGT